MFPFGVGGTVEWDNYGDVWVAPNASIGKTYLGLPASVDSYSGYVQTGNSGPATKEQVRDFLTGPAINGVAAPLFGPGITFSPGAQNKIGLEAHFSLPPQLSGTISFGIPIVIR